MRRIVIATLTVALWCAACRSQGERERSAEATLLVAQFDRMQAASGAAHATALDAFESTPCTSTETCAFRSVCVASHRSFHRVTRELAELRSRADSAPLETSASRALVAELSSAQSDLERSRGEAARCIELRAQLVRSQGEH